MNCRLWVRGWPTRWISMAPPLAIAMCGKRSAGQSIDGLAGMGFRLGFGSGLWVFGSSSYGIAVESAESGCNFIVGLCVQWQFFHSAESSMHLGGSVCAQKEISCRSKCYQILSHASKCLPKVQAPSKWKGERQKRPAEARPEGTISSQSWEPTTGEKEFAGDIPSDIVQSEEPNRRSHSWQLLSEWLLNAWVSWLSSPRIHEKFTKLWIWTSDRVFFGDPQISVLQCKKMIANSSK